MLVLLNSFSFYILYLIIFLISFIRVACRF